MSDQNQERGLIFLEKVRLSFPHLAAPQASTLGGEPKFKADFIMEPTHPGYAAFHARVQELALTQWGEQATAILQWINNDRKMRSYGAGEECIDKNTMQPYKGYPGMVYIKANNAQQPVLFNADGQRAMDARQFYGGCYVNVQVQPWLQDNQHGRAVRCELVGVQFHSDGEAFGVAPVDPTTLFNPVPGAPAAIAPGVMPGQAPAQPMPGQPMPGQPVQPAPNPAAQAPGGYDPSLYPAQQPAPLAPQGAPAALGVPGQQPAPQGAPTPGITPGYPPQQ